MSEAAAEAKREGRDDELDLTGDGKDAPKQPKRGPGRPSKVAIRSDLGKAIQEGLLELAEWWSEHDPELGGILERDAGKMAKVLSARAAKHERVAKWTERIFGEDGPLGVLRAFGPFLRALIAKLPSPSLFPGGDDLDVDELPEHPEDQLAGHPGALG